MRPVLEVGYIFRRHDHAHRAAHDGHLGRLERRVMSAIKLCRTAAKGRSARANAIGRVWLRWPGWAGIASDCWSRFLRHHGADQPRLSTGDREITQRRNPESLLPGTCRARPGLFATIIN